MPPLLLLGQEWWHIGSDDLPAIVFPLSVVHFLWTVASSITCAKLQSLTCDVPSLRAYNVAIIVISATSFLVELLTAALSTRGTILEVSRRSAVPWLFLFFLAVTAADVGVSIFGIYVAHAGDLFGPTDCFGDRGFANLILAVIVGNIIVVGITLVVVLSAHNGFSNHKEPEARWKRRMEVLAPVMALCCGIKKQSLVDQAEDPLIAVARALGVALRHVDFVPSDFAAALVLAGYQEREASALRLRLSAPRGQAVLLSAEAQDVGLQRERGGGAPDEPRELKEVLVEMTGQFSGPEGAEPSERGETESVAADAAAGELRAAAGPPASHPGGRSVVDAGEEALLAARRAMCNAQPGIAEVIAEAAHFIEYALGAYGWPLFVFEKGGKGACDLCCGCGQLCALRHCCCGVTKCCTAGGMDLVALQRFSGLEMADVLFHNYKENHVCGVLPYFIARDEQTRNLVVCVRGTLSVADTITDLLYEPIQVEGAPAGFEAHSGMERCAVAVLKSIESHGILARAAAEERHAGWHLILTGHSLGAGVATLLGAKLRGRWPALRVWAFSPPGGLVSAPFASDSESWCTGVVVGNDFLSRLSMPNIETLMDTLADCVARSRLPKTTIFARSSREGSRLKASDLMYATVEEAERAHPEVGAWVGRYREAVAAHRAEQEARRRSPPDDSTGRRPKILWPPGRILHLLRLGHSGRHRSVYGPRWVTRAEHMERVLVTRNMFFNHFPGKVERELKKLAAEVKSDAAAASGGAGGGGRAQPPAVAAAAGGVSSVSHAAAGDGCTGGGVLVSVAGGAGGASPPLSLRSNSVMIPPGTVGDLTY